MPEPSSKVESEVNKKPFIYRLLLTVAVSIALLVLGTGVNAVADDESELVEAERDPMAHQGSDGIAFEGAVTKIFASEQTERDVPPGAAYQRPASGGYAERRQEVDLSSLRLIADDDRGRKVYVAKRTHLNSRTGVTVDEICKISMEFDTETRRGGASTSCAPIAATATGPVAIGIQARGDDVVIQGIVSDDVTNVRLPKGVTGQVDVTSNIVTIVASAVPTDLFLESAAGTRRVPIPGGPLPDRDGAGSGANVILETE